MVEKNYSIVDSVSALVVQYPKCAKHNKYLQPIRKSRLIKFF